MYRLSGKIYIFSLWLFDCEFDLGFVVFKRFVYVACFKLIIFTGKNFKTTKDGCLLLRGILFLTVSPWALHWVFYCEQIINDVFRLLHKDDMC